MSCTIYCFINSTVFVHRGILLFLIFLGEIQKKRRKKKNLYKFWGWFCASGTASVPQYKISLRWCPDGASHTAFWVLHVKIQQYFMVNPGFSIFLSCQYQMFSAFERYVLLTWDVLIDKQILSRNLLLSGAEIPYVFTLDKHWIVLIFFPPTKVYIKNSLLRCKDQESLK